MKKLSLMIAVFSFMAVTVSFAQSTTTQTTDKDPVKATTTENADMPRSCCKSGSGKSCVKGGSSSKSCSAAEKKSCSHASAADPADKKASNGGVTPASSAKSQNVETEKK